MPGRASPGGGCVMSEAEETARHDALRTAAEAGWTDIDEGRCRDIEPAELESFIRSLGTRTSKGAQHSR